MSELPGEHDAVDPSALEASALVAGTLGMNALRVEALEADTIARAQGSDSATEVEPTGLSRAAHLRQMAAGTGLLGRFVYMAMTQGVTLLLGIAYWTTTTRTFPTHDVGYAAAIVAAAAFVNAIGALGIGTLLLAEIGHVPTEEQRPMLVTGVIVESLVALVLALGTWALSPFLGASLSQIGANPVEALLFVIGTVLTGVASLFDVAAIGLRKGPAQLLRNTVASALRVGLVFVAVWLSHRTTTALLTAWTVSLTISLVVSWGALRLGPGTPGWKTAAATRRLFTRFWSLSLRHHILNLSITSIGYFLPVLAALLLIPQEYAYFSVAQLVSSSVLLLPALIALSLFAEARGDDALLRSHIRRTLPLGMAFCGLVLAIFEPGAHLALSIFGPQYAENGTTILRILLLSGIGYVVKDHYVAIRRAQDHLTDAAKAIAVATGFEVVAAVIGGALFGVIGLSAFWVTATLIEALFFIPTVWRTATLRGVSPGRTADPPPSGSAPVVDPDYANSWLEHDAPAETLLESTSSLPTPRVESTRLGLVLALVGAGLLLQGAADGLARSGHLSQAIPLFLFGIALQFAVCAWRLLGAPAARTERIWVSVALGVGLFASYVMLQPFLLDGFDELTHMGTLVRLLDSHTLFPTNRILPVSPYYPGLELATSATKWITGLPLVVDQLVVLTAVRIVLVLGVFLVVERVCKSSRAGGIGVLVYAASPDFYGFDAQYAYETIALAFAVGAVYFLFVSVDDPRPKIGRSFVLALGSILAVVLSHHVTGWLTVGFLVVWFLGLLLTCFLLRRRTAPLARTRRWAQTRIVGLAAGVGVVVGGAWTWYVGRLLRPYLGPLFSSAASELKEALGSGQGNRTLFKSSAGAPSPHWDIALILAATAVWCLVLVPALYSVVFKRTVRGGLLRYIPALIAALYPLSVLANVSSASKEVAGRATTFIFFGLAVVVGAWLAQRLSRDRRVMERAATIVVAIIVFLGSFLFGNGPLPTLLPGPYQVGADSLSYGSPSLALAHWADTHLPAGSNVAADRDNAVMLNALGGVNAVSPLGGQINPELLYFDSRLSIYDIYLIRKDDIRYLVTDDRLAEGFPLYGVYIASGEPSRRLTKEDLDKFDTYPFIKRIYDNGSIQVYDLTGLLPKSERAAPAGAPVGGSGFNVGISVLAAVVATLWILRWRRRRKQPHDWPHLVMCGLVGALIIAVFGAFLIRITQVPPDIVGVCVLLLLLALSLRPDTWHPRNLALRSKGTREESSASASAESNGTGDESSAASSKGRRPRRFQVVLGCAGVALFALGAILATQPAAKDWTPPPELSVASSLSDHSVAEVQLGSAGPISARVEITENGKKAWASDLARTTTSQSVDLPAHLLHQGSRVELVSDGHTLRWVDGWARSVPPPTASSPKRL